MLNHFTAMVMGTLSTGLLTAGLLSVDLSVGARAIAQTAPIAAAPLAPGATSSQGAMNLETRPASIQSETLVREDRAAQLNQVAASVQATPKEKATGLLATFGAAATTPVATDPLDFFRISAPQNSVKVPLQQDR